MIMIVEYIYICYCMFIYLEERPKFDELKELIILVYFVKSDSCSLANFSCGKETFQEVMHDHLQMMKFFDANLPGCKKLEYTGGHPCVHFQTLGEGLEVVVAVATEGG